MLKKVIEIQSYEHTLINNYTYDSLHVHKLPFSFVQIGTEIGDSFFSEALAAALLFKKLCFV